jgi:hypothetical protein
VSFAASAEADVEVHGFMIMSSGFNPVLREISSSTNI